MPEPPPPKACVAKSWIQRIVLRGKRHAEEQREHAHDGRGQMENFPGHIPSSILYMVLLIWLLASAAKSGLRDPIKCVAPAGHRSLERSHSLLGPRLLAVGQHFHDTVLGLSSLTDELKLFSMSTRNTGLLVQAHSGSDRKSTRLNSSHLG